MGMPTQQLVQRFHLATTQGFADATSTGYVRNVDEVAGFQPHQIRHSIQSVSNLRMTDSEELEKDYPGTVRADVAWKTNRIQLVSLLLHEKPAVYETENLPNMEELSGANVPIRRLNAFEEDGLPRLNAGENHVSIATHNRIIMLGAIRASTSCLECHSVKEDELLGAFSYEFLRSPREPEPRTDSQPL